MADVPEGIAVGEDGTRRCWWCDDSDLYRKYHDEEWGFPVADDRRLFEKLCLEAFQAGLSWLTILKKRENFRQAFDNFQPEAVADYDASDVERLLGDAGIVRNEQKIRAAINNARCLDTLVDDHGSLAAFIWQFEPDPEDRPDEMTAEILREHTTSTESKRLATSLKSYGFKFVGPTTAYAFMQAMGLVNDHVEGCDARFRVESARQSFERPG